MKVLSEKRMELLQTVASLSCSTRMEKGCQRCDFCEDGASMGDVVKEAKRSKANLIVMGSCKRSAVSVFL
jgi:quinol monooxygenase YgiN